MVVVTPRHVRKLASRVAYVMRGARGWEVEQQQAQFIEVQQCMFEAMEKLSGFGRGPQKMDGKRQEAAKATIN
eukprot:8698655-Prorocentrum_lima.AAC.1